MVTLISGCTIEGNVGDLIGAVYLASYEAHSAVRGRILIEDTRFERNYGCAARVDAFRLPGWPTVATVCTTIDASLLWPRPS